MSKRVLITGMGGQDGSHLADILLEQDCEVHGLYRHSSCDNLWRLKHCIDRGTLHKGDVTDPGAVNRIIRDVQPAELFHVADQDNVGWSKETPLHTVNVTIGGVVNVLEAVKLHAPRCKVFVPVSATMFGMAKPPQSEWTPFDPQSPYACAKLAVHHLCRWYRKEHGLFVSTGIMFNHDSPRRCGDYLLQKICRGAVAIARGEQQTLTLGNLNLRVDIGHAKEHMEAAVAMLQLPEPEEFVIGTGIAPTIRQMVDAAFHAAGCLTLVNERIKVDEGLASQPQPTLIADTTKARCRFDFRPRWDALSVADLLVRDLLEKGAKP